MDKYSDRFGAISKVGGLVCAFSPRAIDWENKMVYGLYYNYSMSVWQYGKFPIPTVIYRRDFHTNRDDIEKLIDVTEGKLFNSWRFTKYGLDQYIRKNKELLKHLPETEQSNNYEQIQKFIDKYQKGNP